MQTSLSKCLYDLFKNYLHQFYKYGNCLQLKRTQKISRIKKFIDRFYRLNYILSQSHHKMSL